MQLYFYSSSLLILLLALINVSVQQPAPLPECVTKVMATRDMRYHHYLFHNIRNLWSTLDECTQDKIRSYGWEPPRPAKDANLQPLTENNSGQDFLYMHRQMIALVNRLLSEAGSGPVSGFTTIPAKDDPEYPMPPVYTAPTEVQNNLTHFYKSDCWYDYLKAEEVKLKDPEYLRSVTLGELGAYIEWTSNVHEGMHFRFSAYNTLMRPKPQEVLPYVDSKYDTLQYDWLADIYGSQVNPWFWKLHGWIDDRINDWQAANNLTSIQWNATWTGGNMQTLPASLNITNDPNADFRRLKDANSSMDNMAGMDGMDMGSGADGKTNLQIMEEITAILIEKGVICDYFNELSVGVTKNPGSDPQGSS